MCLYDSSDVGCFEVKSKRPELMAEGGGGGQTTAAAQHKM